MRSKQRAQQILDVVPKCMRAIRTEMRAQVTEDLSIPKFRILVKLAKGEATNRDVAEWMGVSKPTITRMIDNLEERGLVERIAGSPDRREVTLRLTRPGKKTYLSIRNTVRSRLARKVEALSELKQTQLRKGLEILEEVLS